MQFTGNNLNVDWPGKNLDASNKIKRYAARLLIFNGLNQALLLSTRDASNSEFLNSWEIPGGGINQGESIAEAAVREVYEETGIIINLESVSKPLWLRCVLYTYRGEKRLQHEAICVTKIKESKPRISFSNREPFEVEDHELMKWWTLEEVMSSDALFYPRSLPQNIESLLYGIQINDPFECWDE